MARQSAGRVAKQRSAKQLGAKQLRAKQWKLLGGSAMALVLLQACGGGSGSTTASNTAGSASMSTVTQGAINGFGSVIVNGVRYSTTLASLADEDGVAKRASDLSLGMVVQVLGLTDAAYTTGTANSVEIRKAVQGTVETVGSDCAGVSTPSTAVTTYCVLGQSIDTSASTINGNYTSPAVPAIGDMVEVYGVRASSGRVLASLVLKTTNTRYATGGPISQLDSVNHTFHIADLTVNYPSATVLTSTDEVYASGLSYTGSGLAAILSADRVRVRNNNHAQSGATRIRGAVQQLPDSNNIAVINHVSVQLLSTTHYDGFTGTPTLTLNSIVEVQGVYSGTVLQASEIEQANFRASQAGGDGAIEVHGIVLPVTSTTTPPVVPVVPVVPVIPVIPTLPTLPTLPTGSARVVLPTGSAGTHYRVHDITIDTSECSSCASVNYGDSVVVRGSVSAGVLYATSVVDHAGQPVSTSNSVEVYGLISGIDSTLTTFSLGGISVNTANATFPDGARSQLQNGLYVELQGASDSQNVFQATRVLFRRNAD